MSESPGPSPSPGGTPATPEANQAVAALVRRLGLRRPPALLPRALTHPSYAHEHPPEPHNETLAFLGDAVLGLLVADLVVRQDGEAGPGVLTVRRAEIVSTRALAAWAREVGLDASLRLGRGEEQQGGREKESVLATALEAVLGAVYLDGGTGAAEPLVRRLMGLDARPAAAGGPSPP